jgi:hypothetical protein
LQKDAKWLWLDEHQQAFETLRDKLINAPILSYPDFSREMHVTTDASTASIGYYLSFFDVNNMEHVISYGGRNLRANEKNWSVVEIEGLAIVEAIRQYSVYLSNKFTVHSDNISMQWLNSIKNSNGRLLRWSLLLQPYNFEIKYKSSKMNPIADALSRRKYDDKPEISYHGPIDEQEIMHIELDETHNETHTNDTMTKRKLIQITMKYKTHEPETQDHTVFTDDNDVTETGTVNLLTDRPDISTLQRQCDDLGPIIQYLEDDILPTDDAKARKIILEADRYAIIEGILYHIYTPRRGRCEESAPIRQVAVPRSLRGLILRSLHDANFAGGHQSTDRMYKNLSLRYYWPRAWTDCYKHVSTCQHCQTSKRPTHTRRAPLIPIEPESLFHRFHIDYLQVSTPRADSTNLYNKLLVVVDAYSKWTEAFVVKSEKAEECAEILYREIFCRYGAPQVIVSDRGKTFMGQLLSKLCEYFEIDQHFTTSFHAQSNSVAERTHQNILTTLRTCLSGRTDTDWQTLLPGVLASLRSGVCTRSSSFSPYFLLFHKEMRLPVQNIISVPENCTSSTRECIEDINRSIEATHKLATENIKLQQERYKECYDKNATYPQFEIGDLVLLHEPKIPANCRTPKLYQRYRGPYYIVGKHDNFTFTIRDNETQQLHNSRVHANRLKKFNCPSNRLYNAHNPTSNTKKRNRPRPNTTDNGPITTETMSENNTTTATDATKNTRPKKQWWDAERIEATRVRNKRREYKIKWVGNYPSSWVKSGDVSPTLVKEYFINRPERKRKNRRRY